MQSHQQPPGSPRQAQILSQQSVVVLNNCQLIQGAEYPLVAIGISHWEQERPRSSEAAAGELYSPPSSTPGIILFVDDSPSLSCPGALTDGKATGRRELGLLS